ncbi:tachykinin-3a [Scleropages formosus]|uniref:Tachykinin precursor 3a n=1 Tax=Scleropages formosus TaxID=113540 RepID=A0A8C9R6K0_SCLFO|nr:tachykinin-3-like [Scleropages formosus]
MRSALLLALLSLMMTLRSCRSSCDEQENYRSELEKSATFADVPGDRVKRYSDIDYDSFVGLMGRRSAGANNSPSSFKRDMHDVFVGLMGRRSSQTDEARPWRKENAERRPGIFFNKCKLRFRRGI